MDWSRLVENFLNSSFFKKLSVFSGVEKNIFIEISHLTYLSRHTISAIQDHTVLVKRGAWLHHFPIKSLGIISYGLKKGANSSNKTSGLGYFSILSFKAKKPGWKVFGGKAYWIKSHNEQFKIIWNYTRCFKKGYLSKL